ncbi:MAG: Ig-like domain repeat protein [Acidobacteriia bacterium]|nr:Ig-like domain repeat protein [Terriglobia bacterium]
MSRWPPPRIDPYLIELGGILSLYGGTSASAPVFAGMVALLNQYLASQGAPLQSGLGNINPTLYRLAQIAPGVFHDITAGDNLVPCVVSTLDCADGKIGYSAAPAYDVVTGLGSVDAYQLISQWNPRSASATMTLTADPGSIALNDATRLTVTVKSSDSAVTPAGSIDFYLGAMWLGSVALSGSDGTAGAVLTVYGGQFAVGNDTVTAYYSGDVSFNASSASTVIAASLPLANSAVVPSVTPNPVYQQQPDADGYVWRFTLKLAEMAGVATTLTDFTFNGTSRASEIPNLFGSATIPPGGTLSAPLRAKDISPPAALVLGFSGVDADGRLWSQQMAVPLYRQPFVVGLSTAGVPTPHHPP